MIKIAKIGLIVLAGANCAVLFATPDDPNEVIITAPTGERTVPRRGGDSATFRPTDETRFDATTYYKEDPGIRGSDMMHGFTLPLFRGQDARSTHVFLGDMELVDPYSGYALMEDVDVRAFGEMKIHKGMAPWNIPVTQPGGVVQFVPRAVTRSVVEAGVGQGNITGTKVWGLGLWPVTDDFEARVYASHLASSGNYSYYSDNGTIRNSEDDVVRERSNNDRRSHQVLLDSRLHTGRFSLHLLAWEQSGDQGLPIRMASGDGSARLASETRLGEADLRYAISPEWYISATGGTVETKRKNTDAAHDFTLASARTLTTESLDESLSVGFDAENFSMVVRDKANAVVIHQTSSSATDDFSPKQKGTTLYAGALARPMTRVEVELKAQGESAGSKSSGISTIWKGDAADVWAQIGTMERAPTILENVGDGATILTAQDLRLERGAFGELGLRRRGRRYFNWSGEDALTVWAQRWQERIRILPVSATTFRAVNTGEERFNGADARSLWRVSTWELEVAASMMRATNDRGYLIPRTPLWQGVMSAGYGVWDLVTIRGINRYQGRMYDDYENSLEISDVWIQDLTVDWHDPASLFSVGAGIYNVGNVQSIAVRDVATGQVEGRMAWESYSREPLPGRQWLVKAACRW